MPNVEDLERQISQLGPGEFENLLARILPPRIPVWMRWPSSLTGIEATPDVCGGEPCIIRTRIPVWVLEQMRRLGMSEADILRSYPTLRAEDLVHAWAYVNLHRAEIDQQIRENEED